MKKMICIALMALALLLANSLPVLARHGGHFRGGHFGVRLWFGPGWWGPYYPYYPYYAVPRAVVPPPPDTYIEPAPAPEGSNYWYFCQKPEGYYPYVKKCPGGWMRVVPSPPPAEGEEEEE